MHTVSAIGYDGGHGKGAFENKTSVTSITMPSSVNYIGKLAFHYCSNLTKIKMSDAITTIGDSAFESCTALRDFNMPSSLVSIGENAFKGCISLKAVFIPKTVTSIGKDAFAQTNGIVIYGYKGSAAETYTAENGLDFVDVDALLSDVAYTIKPKLSSKIIKPERLAEGTSLKGITDLYGLGIDFKKIAIRLLAVYCGFRDICPCIKQGHSFYP